jgi:hypothetical protein
MCSLLLVILYSRGSAFLYCETERQFLVSEDKRHTVLTMSLHQRRVFPWMQGPPFLVIYTSYSSSNLTEPFWILDMCVVELRCRVHRAVAGAWLRKELRSACHHRILPCILGPRPSSTTEWMSDYEWTGGYALYLFYVSPSFSCLSHFFLPLPQRWYPWNCLLIRIQLHLFSKFRLMKFYLRRPSWTTDACANKDTFHAIGCQS